MGLAASYCGGATLERNAHCSSMPSYMLKHFLHPTGLSYKGFLHPGKVHRHVLHTRPPPPHSRPRARHSSTRRHWRHRYRFATAWPSRPDVRGNARGTRRLGPPVPRLSWPEEVVGAVPRLSWPSRPSPGKPRHLRTWSCNFPVGRRGRRRRGGVTFPAGLLRRLPEPRMRSSLGHTDPGITPHFGLCPGGDPRYTPLHWGRGSP